MKFIIGWGCLLIIALVAPIALPAGGGIRDELEIIYTKKPFLCFAGESCMLFSSPYISASILSKVDLGAPLNVIRIWQNEQGQRWIQVKEHYFDYLGLKSDKPKRGWINV